MATNYFVKARHDISILDPSTADTLGFMLARDNKDTPFWREIDGAALVDLFNTGSPTQFSTDPEKELLLGQSDWRSGFGLEYQDSSDPKRYFNSIGMDLRHKGMAIAGWTSTQVTSTAFPVLIDDTLELWTGDLLNNWTYSETAAQTTLTKESTIIDTGSTYSAKIANTAIAATSYAQLLQTALTWSNTFRGLSVTVTCRVYNLDNALSYGQLIIDDGDGAATSANSATKNAWETVTCTRTLGASASKLDIILRYYCADGGATASYFDNVRLSETGTTTCHADFNSLMYYSKGDQLMEMNASGTHSYVRAFGHAITSLVPFQVSGTDYLFIFFGTSWNYWYMTAAKSFTESTAVVKTFQFGTWVNTTVDTMYANDGVNTVRSTINPLNGGTAWSTQTIIGAAADPITHMREKDGALLIDKTDMPYYLSSAGAVVKSLAPECVSGKATHSGKNSTEWQGEYFRPTGDQALLRAGTLNSWIQPAKYTTNNSDMTGQVEACAGDEEYLYIVVDNSLKIEVLATNLSDPIAWHPIHEITLGGCETAWISTVYQKRLWISSTTASEGLYYLPLPTKYGNITSDSNAVFLTGTYFETPWMHGDFPLDSKALISVTLTMGHTYAADVYFNVNYKKLGDSSWSTTTLKFDGSATSMTETQFFEAAGTSRTSTMFKLKFTAVVAGNVTPVLLTWKAKTVLTTTPKRIYWAKVRIGQGVLDKDGLSMSNKYALQKTCLDNARNATFLTTITDPDNTTHYVRFLPVQSTDNPWRVIVRAEDKEVKEWEYNTLMLECSLS